MAPRPFLRAVTLLTPPILIVYGINKGINHLESRYPPLPADTTTSTALRTPQSTSQFCRHVDVYSAKIPLRHLENRIKDEDSSTPSPQELHEAWARSLIGSSVLRTEGSLIGLLTRWKWHPGDVGDGCNGFGTNRKTGAPRKLLNGVFTVLRTPAERDGREHGLLVSWTLSPDLRRLFEKIARWGYPWRFMSGGRHEISVSEPFKGDGGEYVEVLFATAHDYKIIPEEGDLSKQKAIPEWTGRLHRAFARLVLDVAVRELKWEDERKGKGL